MKYFNSQFMKSKFFAPLGLLSRSYSASGGSTKIQLVSKLRKEMDCSISKAKEALEAHQFIYSDAVAWLKKEMEESALKKAEKVKSRNAVEGLVAVYNHPYGMSASLVEINCETDFVAKSDLFCDLAQKIASTAALFEKDPSIAISDISIDTLISRPLVDSNYGTVQEGCNAVIGKLGENIKPRRGLVALQQNGGDQLVFGAYAHAAGQLVPAGLGRLGSLVALESSTPPFEISKRTELAQLAKKIAQHICGFSPLSIHSKDGVDEECVLMNQSFLFGGGTVAQVLVEESKKHGIELSISEFKRWECGEGLLKETTDFATEVANQIKASA